MQSTSPSQNLPHNDDMERGLLACLMGMQESFDDVKEFIGEDDFYVPRHATIFRAISHLAHTDLPYDEVMVFDWLTAQNLLEQAGGERYLVQIMASPASIFNLKTYAERVKELGALRAIISAAQSIQAAAIAQKIPINEIIDQAESSFGAISERYHQGTSAKHGAQVARELLPELVHEIKQMQLLPEGALRGLPTPFEELNAKTQGLQKGDLIILAARPAMGKTTLAMNLIESILYQRPELPVVVFSMEMGASQILGRMVASLSSIPLATVRSGNISESDWGKIMHSFSALKNANLYIDDGNALTPSEIKSRVRKVAKRHGGQMGLVIIDYLQLMRVPRMENNRVGEISEISRSLKTLAREMKCPVVALSQLNRKLEERGDKRPVMSDLRESGAIEQDADIIMFIYRDEVYKGENSKEPGIAQIIIGKHRNGPIGTVRLAYQGQYSRFTNLSPDYAPIDDYE